MPWAMRPWNGVPERELLVEMHRVGVAGDAGEHQDVGVGDGLAEDGGHALGQILDVVAVKAHQRISARPVRQRCCTAHWPSGAWLSSPKAAKERVQSRPQSEDRQPAWTHSTPSSPAAPCRRSRWGRPGPDEAALQRILAAGAAAPDHGLLRPWRFLVVRGAGRERLGELFAEFVRRAAPDASPEEVEKQRTAPAAGAGDRRRRRPARSRRTPRSPRSSRWRRWRRRRRTCCWPRTRWASPPSGPPASRPTTRTVKEGLGLGADDRIIGFLYLGSYAADHEAPPRPGLDGVVSEWPPAARAERCAPARLAGRWPLLAGCTVPPGDAGRGAGAARAELHGGRLRERHARLPPVPDPAADQRAPGRGRAPADLDRAGRQLRAARTSGRAGGGEPGGTGSGVFTPPASRRARPCAGRRRGGRSGAPRRARLARTPRGSRREQRRLGERPVEGRAGLARRARGRRR